MVTFLPKLMVARFLWVWKLSVSISDRIVKKTRKRGSYSRAQEGLAHWPSLCILSPWQPSWTEREVAPLSQTVIVFYNSISVVIAVPFMSLFSVLCMMRQKHTHAHTQKPQNNKQKCKKKSTIRHKKSAGTGTAVSQTLGKDNSSFTAMCKTGLLSVLFMQRCGHFNDRWVCIYLCFI